MTDDFRVIDAEQDVERTRAQLVCTIREMAEMFEPRRIVQDVWESAKVKGADLAEDAVDAVKKRPLAAGGIVAALAMFLARDPIRDGLGKAYDAMTSGDRKSAKEKPAAKAAARKAPAKAATRPASKRPVTRSHGKKVETKS